MNIYFFFPYKPIAQPRHKIAARGKFARAYIPEEHPVHSYKYGLKIFAKKYYEKPFEGPIQISLTFHIPKARSQKNVLPIIKPDIDNLAKAVLDALNTIAYKDDSQICDLHISKWFASEARPVGVGISVCNINKEDVVL